MQTPQKSQLSKWADQMKQMSHQIAEKLQGPQAPQNGQRPNQLPQSGGLMTSVSQFSHELSADFMWELAIWRDRLVQWSNDVFNFGHQQAESFELASFDNQKSNPREDFYDYGIDFSWFDQMDIDWLQHVFDENHDPEFAAVLERIRNDRAPATTQLTTRLEAQLIFDEPLQSTLSTPLTHKDKISEHFLTFFQTISFVDFINPMAWKITAALVTTI